MAQHARQSSQTPSRLRGNFWLRTIVSIIGGILLAIILIVGGWIYNFFIALLMVALAREWYRLTDIKWLSFEGVFLIALLALLFLLAISHVAPPYTAFILLSGLFLLNMLSFFVTKKEERQFMTWAGWGALYLGLPLIALIYIGGIKDTNDFLIILWLFSVVWACDICAYLVGSMVGGPKLWPKISPNKTWAGLIGGMVGAGLISAIWAAFYPQRTFFVYFAVGLAIALLAQIGDLLESKLKRHFGVKDSGHLIPGHGGVMDRFDGLLFVSPFVAFYFYCIA